MRLFSHTYTDMATIKVVSSPYTGLAVGICAVIFIVFILLRPLLSSSRRIPGPFLARYTRLWLLREVWYGTFPYTSVELHRKYGKMQPPNILLLPSKRSKKVLLFASHLMNIASTTQRQQRLFMGAVKVS